MDEGEEGPLAFLVSATEGEQSGLTLKAVLKENSRLKMALNAHAIVALTDARGVITAVNDKFCAIWRCCINRCSASGRLAA